MTHNRRASDADRDPVPACYECGVRLGEEDVYTVAGDPLCDQCAEERMDDTRTSRPATSIGERYASRRPQHH